MVVQHHADSIPGGGGRAAAAAALSGPRAPVGHVTHVDSIPELSSPSASVSDVKQVGGIDEPGLRFEGRPAEMTEAGVGPVGSLLFPVLIAEVMILP